MSSVGQIIYSMYLTFISKRMAFISFIGQILYSMYLTFFTGRQKLYFIDFLQQMYAVGIQSLPIIVLINFSAGIVLTHQGLNTLHDYGQIDKIAYVIAPIYVRYVASLLTAVVIAGRSGSAFTAQIGSMQLNQEIDALRSMNVNPIGIIVLPRFFATTLMLPFVITAAIVAGILGGAVMANFLIDMPIDVFLQTTQRIIKIKTFLSTLIKAILFGQAISVIGCYRGFCVHDNATVLGKMTTRSVVECIFYVLMFDGILSTYYAFLEI